MSLLFLRSTPFAQSTITNMLKHVEDRIRAATVQAGSAVAEKGPDGVARPLAVEVVTELIFAERLSAAALNGRQPMGFRTFEVSSIVLLQLKRLVARRAMDRLAWKVYRRDMIHELVQTREVLWAMVAGEVDRIAGLSRFG